MLGNDITSGIKCLLCVHIQILEKNYSKLDMCSNIFKHIYLYFTKSNCGKGRIHAVNKSEVTYLDILLHLFWHPFE